MARKTSAKTAKTTPKPKIPKDALWPRKPAPDETLAVYKMSEAAHRLRIGRNAIYDAAKRNQIPTIRIGRRLLVPRAALEKLLEGAGSKE